MHDPDDLDAIYDCEIVDVMHAAALAPQTGVNLDYRAGNEAHSGEAL